MLVGKRSSDRLLACMRGCIRGVPAVQFAIKVALQDSIVHANHGSEGNARSIAS